MAKHPGLEYSLFKYHLFGVCVQFLRRAENLAESTTSNAQVFLHGKRPTGRRLKLTRFDT
jgi:hypothetical protein